WCSRVPAGPRRGRTPGSGCRTRPSSCACRVGSRPRGWGRPSPRRWGRWSGRVRARPCPRGSVGSPRPGQGRPVQRSFTSVLSGGGGREDGADFVEWVEGAHEFVLVEHGGHDCPRGGVGAYEALLAGDFCVPPLGVLVEGPLVDDG